jgi:hypothetical protein
MKAPNTAMIAIIRIMKRPEIQQTGWSEKILESVNESFGLQSENSRHFKPTII